MDGLWDIYNQYHMGITAENVAKQFNISRKQQDEFAALSQKKTHNAIVANKFKDEIVPVILKVKKQETVFEQDEHPKTGSTVEKLGTLRPAFKENGSVTAGNASGLNDGAAAAVLMTEETAKKKNLKTPGSNSFVGSMWSGSFYNGNRTYSRF